MSELSGLAATATTVVVDGRSYVISPLGLRELAEFESWLEMLPIEQVKKQFDGLQPEERRLLLEKAYEDSRPGKVSISSEAATGMMGSVRGFSYLLWLSLRKAHPGIAQDEAAGLLRMDNIDELKNALYRVSGISDENPTTPTSAQELVGQSNGPKFSVLSPSAMAGPLSR